jgi:hypothetical protein
MRLHRLTLRFASPKLEAGYQRHRAASLQQADAWWLMMLLLGPLLSPLSMQLPLAATEGAVMCSSETLEDSSSSIAAACSMEQEQPVQSVLLLQQQQLRMACIGAAAACALACMAAVLLRQLYSAWYMQHRTFALCVCAVLAAAVSQCSLAAVLQAGTSSSAACSLQAIGVLLFVSYAVPFAYALPAVVVYCSGLALLLHTAAAEPAQHLLLLLGVVPIAGLYLLERRARLAFWSAAAAAACDDASGSCDDSGCDTADRTCSGSQQHEQHHHHHHHHHHGHHQHHPQQQQQQQQPGMAVLAPVTLPAGSGAVPVPAALGYSSVFQRSVLAIKVQAPTTGTQHVGLIAVPVASRWTLCLVLFRERTAAVQPALEQQGYI